MGFEGNMVSVMTTQLYHSVKGALDSTHASVVVPIKLYLQKQVASWIWHMAHKSAKVCARLSHSFLHISYTFFFFLVFLEPHQQPMEVPRLGVELEL